MARIDAYGIESIKALRKDDENRTLELRIECEDGTTFRIAAGQYCDDAESLESMLRNAAATFKAEVITDWEDVPDFDDDGVVFENDCRDGGGYCVKLSGHFWSDGVLVPHNQERNVRPFPTLDIAYYELACAMSAEGYFPNLWYQNERGNWHNIYPEMRKYHDEGGTDVVPLAGVTFAEGADVMHEGSTARIVKDYGTELGVVFRYNFSESKGDEHTIDRSSLLPLAECNYCDAVITQDAQGVWHDADDNTTVCTERETTGRYPDGKPHAPEGDE